MHDLEVLNRRLGDTAVEVKNVGLCVVVPYRRLVVELNEVVQGVTVPPAQQALLLLPTHTQLAVRLLTFLTAWPHLQSHCMFVTHANVRKENRI